MPPRSVGWQVAQDWVLSPESRTSWNSRSPSATRTGSTATVSGTGTIGSVGGATGAGEETSAVGAAPGSRTNPATVVASTRICGQRLSSAAPLIAAHFRDATDVSRLLAAVPSRRQQGGRTLRGHATRVIGLEPAGRSHWSCGSEIIRTPRSR